MLSLYTLLFMGTTPFGGAITGFLADNLGVTPTLTIEASICLIATLVGMLYLARAARRRAASEVTLAAR